MAEDTPSAAWKEAEALLSKGKSAGVLEVLRDVDPNGEHGTTLRLAGQATHMQASKSGSKKDFRKAAKLLFDSVQKNPRDKAANSSYNQVRNEMQERGISERIIPRLTNNGTPTPAGLFALVASILIVIAGLNSIQNAKGTGGLDGDVILEVSWTDRDGVAHTGKIWLELYDADTPMHAESFRANVDSGRYDGIPFHRIVDGFMIQGGDFVNKAGTGGYAGAYFGYCKSGNFEQTNDCEDDQTQWVVPAEFGQTHKPGVLAAARSSSENSHGSQFYLVDSTGAYTLDDSYTAFGIAYDGEIDGESTTGVAVIDAISQVECIDNSGACSDDDGAKSVHPVTVDKAYLMGQADPWWQFW
jgi:cyclophilin family peptidyl-prolyl cis-trans isomerase